ncbi:MAG: hypothetical protein H0U54_11030 [Acidobacteria bacterium]|nr:hypothetical protein [Acidobacteriota bacterium]
MKLQLTRINLSIALFNVLDLAGAKREAEKLYDALLSLSGMSQQSDP